MALKVYAPAIEMGGGQVIRIANKDRPMSWLHFESEVDAIAAHKQLTEALGKAVKLEWP